MAHHEYLTRFHKRRLRRNQNGRVPESALADRVDFSQDYATDNVSCTRCGLVFRNPRPTQEVVARTYAQERYGQEHLRAALHNQLDFFREKAETVDRWLAHDRAPHVVEVGSFVGGFLTAGQERGWDMMGVDPGREVTTFCRQRGLRVHHGTLAEALLKPRSVDGIAIWNTFDQLPDPNPTLTITRRALRPEGVLIVRVPNGACFRLAETWVRRLPRPLSWWLKAAMAWNNLLGFPYLYGYSLQTLDRLMHRHGLQRVAVYPETLVRLADQHTHQWAVEEERTIKSLCRALARLEAMTFNSQTVAPWLDVYYRPAH
ncbi:MAG: class I SAM-dependent methyltransferase [Nitrospiraceae bacterium]